MSEYAGRWITWQYDGWQCCGVPSVDVYPANLVRIQHQCGAWIVTPPRDTDGKRIVERGVGVN
jgi:hypothetical protein